MAKRNPEQFLDFSAKETSAINNNNNTSQTPAIPTSVDKEASLLPDPKKAREETLAKINAHYKQGVEYFRQGKLDEAEQELVQAMKPVLSKNAMRALYVELEDCKESMLDAMYHLGKIYEKSEKYQDNYSKAAAIFQYCSEFVKKYNIDFKTDFIKEAYATEAKFLASIGAGDKAKSYEDYQKQIGYYKGELETIRSLAGEHLKKIEHLTIEQIAERAKAVEEIYEASTSFFVNNNEDKKTNTGLIQQLLAECYEHLGPVPKGCEHAIIGFGSLAGGKMTPWSDLEFGILINEDKAEYKEYFRNLTKLLHIKVINLGETPLRSIGIESLNNFKTAQAKDDWFWDEVMTSGVSFDGAHWHACKLPLGRQGYKAEEKKQLVEKPDYELILTPAQMAKFQSDKPVEQGNGKQEVTDDQQTQAKSWYGSDKHLVQALKSVALIEGSQRLLDTYREAVSEVEDTEIIQSRALEILAEDVDNFSLKLGDGEEGKLFDVKKGIYRVGDRIVEALANYYAIEPEPGQPNLTVWQVIAKMATQGLLAPEGAQHLKEAISIATELRLATYCYNKGQKEGVSTYVPTVEHLTEEKKKEIIEETFFIKDTSILHHFYYVVLRLQDIVKKFDLDLSYESLLQSDLLIDHTYYTRGLIHARFLEYDRALECLKQAKDNNFKEPSFLSDLYFLQSKTGQIQDAINTAHDINTLLTNQPVLNYFDIGGNYSNLGAAYRAKGEYDLAIEYYTKALSICEQLAQANNIAINYNNLGNVYNAKADFDKAIELRKKAINAWKSIYSGDSKEPHLAISYINITASYNFKGDYNKAIKYNKKALDIFQKIYVQNPNHPHIASSYNSLGSIYTAKEEYKEAIIYFNRALQIWKKYYSNNLNHPDIAVCYNNLGAIYRAQKEYEVAGQYHEKALKIQLQCYASSLDNPDIALTYNNLGYVNSAKGFYSEAIDYHKKALLILKKAYPADNHPSSANAYKGLGNVYWAKGNYNKAITNYEKAAKSWQAVHINTPNHPDIAKVYEDLMQAHKNQKDYITAIDYGIKALNIWKLCDSSNQNQVNTANCYHKLGTLFFIQKEYNSAIEFYNKAIGIWQEVYTSNFPHADIGMGYNNLGAVYKAMRQLDDAMACYKKALSIMELCYIDDPNHDDFIKIYDSLGALYYEQGNNNQAFYYYDKALKIREQVLPALSFEIADNYNNLASVCKAKGDTNLAIKYHKLAIDIKEKIYGYLPHPDIAASYNNLSVAYYVQGNFEQAEDSAEKAIQNQGTVGNNYQELYNHILKIQAIEAFVVGNDDKAKTLLVKIDKKYEKVGFISVEFITLLMEQAEIEYKSNALTAAICCQKAWLKVDPELKFSNHYHNLACFYAAAGKVTEAYEAFNEALKRSPNVSLHVEYAQFLLHNMDLVEVEPQEALKHLNIVFNSNSEAEGELRYSALEKNSICVTLKNIIEQKNAIILVNPVVLAHYLLVKYAKYLGLDTKEILKLSEELMKLSNNLQDEISFRLLAGVCAESGKQQDANEYLEYAELIDQIDKVTTGKTSTKTLKSLSEEKVQKYADNLHKVGKLAVSENRLKDAQKLYIRLFNLQDADLIKIEDSKIALVADELATICLMNSDVKLFTYLKAHYGAKINPELVTFMGKPVDAFLSADHQIAQQIKVLLQHQQLANNSQTIPVKAIADNQNIKDEDEVKPAGEHILDVSFMK